MSLTAESRCGAPLRQPTSLV